jgi:hypothetical protein
VIYVLGALCVAQLGAIVYLQVRAQRERSALVGAMLQANDKPDARRVFAQADQDARRRVQDQLEAAKVEVNPDGTVKPPTPKPVGI